MSIDEGIGFHHVILFLTMFTTAVMISFLIFGFLFLIVSSIIIDQESESLLTSPNTSASKDKSNNIIGSTQTAT